MDLRRGHSVGREAVASSSGRPAVCRPCAGRSTARHTLSIQVSTPDCQRRIAPVEQPYAPRRTVCRATVGSLPPPPLLSQDDFLLRSLERTKRLTTLVETRRLYRNCIRAKYLLDLNGPVYRPPPPEEQDRLQQLQEQRQQAALQQDRRLTGSGSLDQVDVEEDKALKSALEAVAEMTLTAEQLKGGLRALPAGFGAVFPAGSERESEARVREVARQYAARLRDRLAAELAALPVSLDAALHYIELRNAKYARRPPHEEQHSAGAGAAVAGGGSSSAGASAGSSNGTLAAGAGAEEGGGPGATLRGLATARERLEAAERAAGRIIANSIKPALKKASEQDLFTVARDTGSYLRGLWVRLNGGKAPPGSLKEVLEGLQLPVPDSTRERSELAISKLGLELEALEKQLQELSRQRENKLRKAGLAGRVKMAMQLKGLDAEVLQLSARLAVRTLQLEMEHIYGSLEAEALDCFSEAQRAELITRDGSTNELALLVAEFALLDEQLTLLAGALDSLGAPALGAPAGLGLGLSLGGVMNDEVLSKLAADIPDMRARVGVADQAVFGSQGFSLTKTKLQISESMDKVTEAINFLTRGFKLLGSDVGNATRLFGKAALGNTLKPREVTALRRTARDLLTFIPFTIILIIPLSPLGHVLVFGFIQRYFPSFFPSQFSSKRQEIMVRYEELERRLLEAQANAEAAEEEAELARARVAVQRLTAPDTLSPTGSMDGGVGAVVMGPAGSLMAVGPQASGGGGGGAGSASAVAAGLGGGGGPLPAALSGIPGGLPGGTRDSMDLGMSLDEATLAQAHQATRKVKLLEEELDVIRDDVAMGDPEGEQEQGVRTRGAEGAAGGGAGGGRW